MRWLKAADYCRTAWKNGGGVTAEIAAFPAGAGLAEFDWRLSIAEVAMDGPFSAFPGIDRTLTVLSGAMELGGRVLDAGADPFRFDGALPLEARLLAGPVTDLNVMTRRGRFSHKVERRMLARGETLAAGDGWLFLVALVDGVAGIARHDALMLSSGQELTITEGGSALLVDIHIA